MVTGIFLFAFCGNLRLCMATLQKGLAHEKQIWYYAKGTEKHINFIGCLPLRVDGSARGKRNPVRIRSLFRKLYAHECLYRAERRPLYAKYEKVDAGAPGSKAR